jgi:hypothetical protein
MRRPLALCIAVCVQVLAGAACAGAVEDGVPAAESSGPLRIEALELRVPKDRLVSFSGVVSYDAAGGRPGYMAYPAPDPISAVAGLVTHGVIVGFQRKHEKSQIREAANEVLAPYEAVLERFTNADLMRRALDALEIEGNKALISATDAAVPGVLVECRPAFFMTQDGRALVLENSIVVRRIEAKAVTKGAASVVATANPTTVKVVGSPLPEADSNIEAYWMAEEGDALQTASVNLLRDSLILALQDVHGPAAAYAADFRTVRYREGGAEKIERARILNESNSRLVLRNLRGWILSVPITTSAAAPTAQAHTDTATADAVSREAH